MTDPAAPVLTYSRVGKTRRRILWLALVLLIAAGAVVWRQWDFINENISHRRAIYTAYKMERRCLRASPGSQPAITLMNTQVRGQTIAFSRGVASSDLDEFIGVASGLSQRFRPAGTQSVAATHEVTRPDGVKRLLSVECDWGRIQSFVWSVGTPFTPAELLKQDSFGVILPPHRPFTLGPGLAAHSSDVVTLGAGFPDGAITGSIDFAIGNDDAVTIRPSFGWVPPEMPDQWAPAGQPAGWPNTVTPTVASLPFTGHGIGFQGPNIVVIPGGTVCKRIDITTGAVISSLDYGKLVRYGIREALVSPDGLNVAVITNGLGWFVVGTSATPDEVAKVKTQLVSCDGLAFSPSGKRLATAGQMGIRYLELDGGKSPPSPDFAGHGIAAGSRYCVVSAQSNMNDSVVVFFPWEDPTEIGGFRLRDLFNQMSISQDQKMLTGVASEHAYFYDFPSCRMRFRATPDPDLNDNFIDCRPAVLPGGKWAVVAGRSLGLYLYDLPLGKKNLRIAGVQNVVDMAVSPDGKTLAVLTTESVKLLKIDEITLAAQSTP